MEGKFNPEAIQQPPQEQSAEERRETLPDIGEVVKQGHEAAEGANTQIATDLESAIALHEQLGEQARPVVEQIKGLQKEVEEKKAAFDARAERLNSPYVLSPDLAKVLKVSRVLKRPLLLEGEPGTGKTSLAYALAGHEDLPIIHAQCKSTTTAQELLYTFDVVQRLQDAQLGKDVSDPKKYVKFGPLGRAFSSQEQVILLIDEVDKAKRDFSNDLLHELDQMSFFVTETGEEVAAKHRPIVIVTSNHERDLPEPVLRRCVYNYIEFPNPEQMTEIVKAHVPDINEVLLKEVITKFYTIRKIEGLEKRPSTSEMLDWVRVLKEFNVSEISDDILYPETLLKSKADLESFMDYKLKGERKDDEEDNDIEKQEMPKTPPLVTAVLEGQKVVRLKNYAGGYARKFEPLKKILEVFIENDIHFSQERFGSFNISLYNVKKLDELLFAIPYSKSYRGPIYIASGDRKDYDKTYELLKNNDLLASEFVISDEDIQIEEIKNGNDEYIEGFDKDGNRVYQYNDGKRKVSIVEKFYTDIFDDSDKKYKNQREFDKEHGLS
jgi:MoxR-like ATPase